MGVFTDTSLTDEALAPQTPGPAIGVTTRGAGADAQQQARDNRVA